MDTFEQFLRVMQGFAPQPILEPNFFALGGRGHLENPTSDMMAFFMGSKGPNWLGKALFRCLVNRGLAPEECLSEDWSHVEVRREVSIKKNSFDVNTETVKSDANERQDISDNSKYLDIVISHPKWVLLIENKVNHTAKNNPFEIYDLLPNSHPGKTALRCVVRPTAKTNDVPLHWPVISYGELVQQAFKTYSVDVGNIGSKWKPFYKEFLRHLESLANPNRPVEMQKIDFDLAYQHYENLTKATSLLGHFKSELAQRSVRVLVNAFKEIGIATSVKVRFAEWDGNRPAIRLFPACWKESCEVAIVLPPSSPSQPLFFAVWAYIAVSDTTDILQLRSAFETVSPLDDRRWLAVEREQTWEESNGSKLFLGFQAQPIDKTDLNSAMQALASLAVWLHNNADLAISAT